MLNLEVLSFWYLSLSGAYCRGITISLYGENLYKFGSCPLIDVVVQRVDDSNVNVQTLNVLFIIMVTFYPISSIGYLLIATLLVIIISINFAQVLQRLYWRIRVWIDFLSISRQCHHKSTNVLIQLNIQVLLICYVVFCWYMGKAN